MFSTITELFNKSQKKINFEDVQFVIKHPYHFLLINTLSASEQDCLIKTTLQYEMEEKTINDMLTSYDLHSKKIILYGKSTNDELVDKKHKQMSSLGFQEIYVYSGGMFEWMLLQDVYGFDEFPTTRKVLDILKYKPERKLKI